MIAKAINVILEQAPQGSGGAFVPEIVQKMRRCASALYGLVDMGVLRWNLHSLALEVFSNPDDSMIQWF